ncbi:protein regulator of cytokinesis 1 [Megalops cyprinoides]|uniref:protein regulator of cytokinesis 1 n=1 Tax=Megalops cyprinoides TaxID=118141 RepID=UPI0018655EFC|nr:protein regulator of cytokinesis 1 [Megalops cyprinoides]
MPSRRSEALAVSLVTGINLAMARLVDIWDSIGIMEEQRVERMETVKKHIESLMNDMIAEEEALKHRIGSNIVAFQKQLEGLYAEMSLEPYKLEEGLTVLQTEKNLRLRLEALLKEKNDRLKEMRSLQQQDEELCVELCATPYYIPTGSMPSRTQLQQLREHIKTLSDEKKSRLKVFAGLREDIARLMGEMGHEPETSLEKEAVSSDDDVFLLTHENIKALQLLLCQLQVKKESLTSTRDDLRNRATSLWDRLECTDQERREFQDGLPGTLSDEIAQWQKEVDRLEMLQKAKLEEVINKIRQELVHFWDKCMFGPKQREPFNAHFCDSDFTEGLLLLHEDELLRVKACYEKARPLLEIVEKWEKNWALFQEFERKASDPNRFSNRGGALLKEAKERVRVQKMLPKLEEELRSVAQDWEKQQGSPFLVQGQGVMEYVASQWEEHRLQRDKEKGERMTKKGETTPFKTPSKRPHGGASAGVTPSKIRKTPNQSMMRTTCASSNGTPSTFISLAGKPPLSTHKRNRALDISQASPLQELNGEKKHLRIGSYSEFTNELSKKASYEAVLNSTAKDIL